MTVLAEVNPVINWTFVVIVACAMVALAIVIFVALGSYASPRIERLAQGKKLKGGDKPCCPPGLGCNDTSGNDAMKQCRREKASILATPEQLKEMEGHWTEFNATSPKKRKKRREALAEFGRVRDTILFQHAAKMVSEAGEGPIGISEHSEKRDKVRDRFGI